MKVNTDNYAEQQQKYEHCLAENLKLKKKMNKLKYAIENIFDESTWNSIINSSKKGIPREQRPKRENSKRRQSFLEDRTENRNHNRSKLSSTKIKNTISHEIINCMPTDVSSINSIGNTTVNSTNSSIISSDNSTDSFLSTVISRAPSFSIQQQSSTLSNAPSIYKTASASSILDFELTNNESIAPSISSSDSAYSHESNINIDAENEISRTFTTNITDASYLSHSDAVRNISIQSVQPSHIFPNNFHYGFDNGSNQTNIFPLKSIHEHSIIDRLPNSPVNVENDEKEAESVRVITPPVTSSDSQSVFNIASPAMVTYDTTDIQNDLPIETSSCHHSNVLQDSYFHGYKNIFNTHYMKYCIRNILEDLNDDISNDIIAYLPNEMISDEMIGDEIIGNDNKSSQMCPCCLCKIRIQNNDLFEYCIRMHPATNVECQRENPKKSNKTQYKYQSQTICDYCISSMILNSSKRSKEYSCIFDSCSQTFKSRNNLENHYFKHFKVKKYLCTICDKDFSKSFIKMHERKHAM